MDDILAGYEEDATAAIRQVLDTWADRAADAIAEGASWDGAVRDGEMLDALADAVYAPVFTRFARESYEAIEGVTKSFDDWGWGEVLRRIMERVGASRVTKIGETTRKRLRQIVAAAAEEGLGTDATARQLREVTGEINGVRSRRIARTELGTAANTATHEGTMAAASDLGVELTKQWISTPDERRRDFHAGIAQVDADQPFTVPDPESGVVEMQHPNALGAPAHQVINCRCAVGYRPKE